jgi:hypothetical protein
MYAAVIGLSALFFHIYDFKVFFLGVVAGTPLAEGLPMRPQWRALERQP